MLGLLSFGQLDRQTAWSRATGVDTGCWRVAEEEEGEQRRGQQPAPTPPTSTRSAPSPAGDGTECGGGRGDERRRKAPSKILDNLKLGPRGPLDCGRRPLRVRRRGLSRLTSRTERRADVGKHGSASRRRSYRGSAHRSYHGSYLPARPQGRKRSPAARSTPGLSGLTRTQQSPLTWADTRQRRTAPVVRPVAPSVARPVPDRGARRGPGRRPLRVRRRGLSRLT